MANDMLCWRHGKISLSFGFDVSDYGDRFLMPRTALRGDPVGSLIVADHPLDSIGLDLHDLWSRLRERGGGHAKTYQSPTYLAFAEEVEIDASAALVTVSTTQGVVVGLAPIKIGAIDLAFTWGFRKLGRFRLRALSVLGSVPLIAEDIDVGPVFQALAHGRNDFDAIELEYLSQDSPLWSYILKSDDLKRSFLVYVVDGFQSCHSVKVPDDVDAYYRSFSRKRRYNLIRQERLLREKIEGDLQLMKIVSWDNFHVLAEAVHALSGWGEKEERVELARLRSLCGHGLLACYVLKSNAGIIGLVLGFSHLTSLHIMRFFHDKRLSTLSPGTTLWQIVLRDIIQNREYQMIYMGYGEPQYRYSNTNHIYIAGRVLLFRRTPANRVRMLTHMGYRWIKQLAKARLSRKPSPLKFK
jgi:hypothetical protein